MDEEMETVEFETLTGEHLLSGVDETNRMVKSMWGNMEDCQCINFVLDGKTYTAIEDPNDGYRSALRGIFVTDEILLNMFEPVKVIVSYREKSEGYSAECEILDFIDAANGNRILEIGTDNTDDYYPSFVAAWRPEQMAVNQKK